MSHYKSHVANFSTSSEEINLFCSESTPEIVLNKTYIINSDENICSICQYQLIDSTTLNCKHTFCTNCVFNLVNHAIKTMTISTSLLIRCPICRYTIFDYKSINFYINEYKKTLASISYDIVPHMPSNLCTHNLTSILALQENTQNQMSPLLHDIQIPEVTNDMQSIQSSNNSHLRVVRTRRINRYLSYDDEKEQILDPINDSKLRYYICNNFIANLSNNVQVQIPIICNYCSKDMYLFDLYNHLKENCQNAIHCCVFKNCTYKNTCSKFIKEHLTKCNIGYIICYFCNINMKKDVFNDHLKLYCKENIISNSYYCSYEKYMLDV